MVRIRPDPDLHYLYRWYCLIREGKVAISFKEARTKAGVVLKHWYIRTFLVFFKGADFYESVCL